MSGTNEEVLVKQLRRVVRKLLTVKLFQKGTHFLQLGVHVDINERPEGGDGQESSALDLAWAAFAGNLDDITELVTEASVDINGRDARGRTPLHWACVQSKPEVLQWMLEAGAEFEVADTVDFTPLMLASMHGNVDAVKLLLAAGTDPTRTDQEGFSALHWATSQAHSDIIPLLIAAGADVNERDSKNRTSLMIAAGSGKVRTMMRLLEADADPAMVDAEGHTALHWAVGNNHSALVEKLARKFPDIVNVANDQGNTPLHFAAYEGYLACVSVLVKAGANPAKANVEQCTPLHWAAATGRTRICEILCSANASINAVDVDGRTALQEAALNEHYPTCKILLDGGADPNVADPQGRTVLHFMGASGDVRTIKLFVASGADVDARDAGGGTALHCAAFAGQLDAMKRLVAAKAETNVADAGKRTPLHWAAYRGSEKAVALLLLRGSAKVNPLDDQFKTPLDYCLSEDSEGTAELATKMRNQGARTGSEIATLAAVTIQAAWRGHATRTHLAATAATADSASVSASASADLDASDASMELRSSAAAAFQSAAALSICDASGPLSDVGSASQATSQAASSDDVLPEPASEGAPTAEHSLSDTDSDAADGDAADSDTGTESLREPQTEPATDDELVAAYDDFLAAVVSTDPKQSVEELLEFDGVATVVEALRARGKSAAADALLSTSSISELEAAMLAAVEPLVQPQLTPDAFASAPSARRRELARVLASKLASAGYADAAGALAEQIGEDDTDGESPELEVAFEAGLLALDGAVPAAQELDVRFFRAAGRLRKPTAEAAASDAAALAESGRGIVARLALAGECEGAADLRATLDVIETTKDALTELDDSASSDGLAALLATLRGQVNEAVDIVDAFGGVYYRNNLSAPDAAGRVFPRVAARLALATPDELHDAPLDARLRRAVRVAQDELAGEADDLVEQLDDALADVDMAYAHILSGESPSESEGDLHDALGRLVAAMEDAEACIGKPSDTEAAPESTSELLCALLADRTTSPEAVLTLRDAVLGLASSLSPQSDAASALRATMTRLLAAADAAAESGVPFVENAAAQLVELHRLSHVAAAEREMTLGLPPQEVRARYFGLSPSNGASTDALVGALIGQLDNLARVSGNDAAREVGSVLEGAVRELAQAEKSGNVEARAKAKTRLDAKMMQAAMVCADDVPRVEAMSTEKLLSSLTNARALMAGQWSIDQVTEASAQVRNTVAIVSALVESQAQGRTEFERLAELESSTSRLDAAVDALSHSAPEDVPHAVNMTALALDAVQDQVQAAFMALSGGPLPPDRALSVFLRGSGDGGAPADALHAALSLADAMSSSRADARTGSQRIRRALAMVAAGHHEGHSELAVAVREGALTMRAGAMDAPVVSGVASRLTATLTSSSSSIQDRARASSTLVAALASLEHHLEASATSGFSTGDASAAHCAVREAGVLLASTAVRNPVSDSVVAQVDAAVASALTALGDLPHGMPLGEAYATIEYGTGRLFVAGGQMSHVPASGEVVGSIESAVRSVMQALSTSDAGAASAVRRELAVALRMFSAAASPGSGKSEAEMVLETLEQLEHSVVKAVTGLHMQRWPGDTSMSAEELMALLSRALCVMHAQSQLGPKGSGKHAWTDPDVVVGMRLGVRLLARSMEESGLRPDSVLKAMRKINAALGALVAGGGSLSGRESRVWREFRHLRAALLRALFEARPGRRVGEPEGSSAELSALPAMWEQVRAGAATVPSLVSVSLDGLATKVVLLLEGFLSARDADSLLVSPLDDALAQFQTEYGMVVLRAVPDVQPRPRVDAALGHLSQLVHMALDKLVAAPLPLHAVEEVWHTGSGNRGSAASLQEAEAIMETLGPFSAGSSAAELNEAYAALREAPSSEDAINVFDAAVADRMAAVRLLSVSQLEAGYAAGREALEAADGPLEYVMGEKLKRAVQGMAMRLADAAPRQGDDFADALCGLEAAEAALEGSLQTGGARTEVDAALRALDGAFVQAVAVFSPFGHVSSSSSSLWHMQDRMEAMSALAVSGELGANPKHAGVAADEAEELSVQLGKLLPETDVGRALAAELQAQSELVASALRLGSLAPSEMRSAVGGLDASVHRAVSLLRSDGASATSAEALAFEVSAACSQVQGALAAAGDAETTSSDTAGLLEAVESGLEEVARVVDALESEGAGGSGELSAQVVRVRAAARDADGGELVARVEAAGWREVRGAVEAAVGEIGRRLDAARVEEIGSQLESIVAEAVSRTERVVEAEWRGMDVVEAQVRSLSESCQALTAFAETHAPREAAEDTAAAVAALRQAVSEVSASVAAGAAQPGQPSRPGVKGMQRPEQAKVFLALSEVREATRSVRNEMVASDRSESTLLDALLRCTRLEQDALDAVACESEEAGVAVGAYATALECVANSGAVSSAASAALLETASTLRSGVAGDGDAAEAQSRVAAALEHAGAVVARTVGAAVVARQMAGAVARVKAAKHQVAAEMNAGGQRRPLSLERLLRAADRTNEALTAVSVAAATEVAASSAALDASERVSMIDDGALRKARTRLAAATAAAQLAAGSHALPSSKKVQAVASQLGQAQRAVLALLDSQLKSASEDVALSSIEAQAEMCEQGALSGLSASNLHQATACASGLSGCVAELVARLQALEVPMAPATADKIAGKKVELVQSAHELADATRSLESIARETPSESSGQEHKHKVVVASKRLSNAVTHAMTLSHEALVGLRARESARAQARAAARKRARAARQAFFAARLAHYAALSPSPVASRDGESGKTKRQSRVGASPRTRRLRYVRAKASPGAERLSPRAPALSRARMVAKARALRAREKRWVGVGSSSSPRAGARVYEEVRSERLPRTVYRDGMGVTGYGLTEEERLETVDDAEMRARVRAGREAERAARRELTRSMRSKLSDGRRRAREAHESEARANREAIKREEERLRAKAKAAREEELERKRKKIWQRRMAARKKELGS
ncbi:uncharacterized protein AMSG_09310 [Thecamonas trahens ATCC 50062]|uniref:Uncharacterized protein n=1 Tax=Thecamonas trahens ATCC 50062 TaxID=461836 RepID=A0A0L0DP72_THETB|nr:hypothetical protein AMSG_09310 [Thecamonas trahens ATCC 50062]KNC53223.1 hypothetical protein AMSG_09310 [Thecamonas trahens ATCC 50062]|eukprot:XP_013754692.1 hypothetical protein AMSG_09310 [Thecamonas trahens ATCC 50062]